MTLDPRFICSSDMEGVYLDKLTGLPLAAGVINFYSDVNRTTPKSVYQLSGSPPYSISSFTPLGTSITLNSVGGYEDGSGNSIVIYYFPYQCDIDGDPTTSTGVVELYYNTVFNSGGTQQFTREAWPPLASNLFPVVVGNNGVKNYIPNGQFLAHNNNPITDTTTQSGLSILQMAQGGWSWKITTGSTGTYIISFNDEVANRSADLNDYPFASVNINCTSFGNETIHDLVIQWPDVNVFQTLIAGNQANSFNLLFAAKVSAGTQQFSIHLISNYGSGGSAQVDTTISTVTVTSNYQYFNISIPASSFPNNSAADITPGNFIAIAIRTPGNAFIARFTDFALTLNSDTTYDAFPLMTEDEMLSRGVAGWMPAPNPDGSDLYLPLVLTDQGMIFDHSGIGSVVGNIKSTVVNNELLCDGTQYLTSAYSSIGIPYSRLQKILFNSTIGMPLYGTGYNFATTFILAAAGNYLQFSTNSQGTHTAPSAGTSGFTISLTHTAASGAGGYGINVYKYSSASLLCKGQAVGTATAPSAGTSGFTVTDSVLGVNNNINNNTYHYFTVVTVAASSLANPGSSGLYFKFSIVGPATYYVWFQITNETDPAPGGVGVKVNLVGTETADDVANIVMSVMNAGGQYLIQTTAGSAITAGSYWTFGVANTSSYYVWYKVSGSGSDPAPGGYTLGIEVDILSGDTNAQVATKTRNAFNSSYFAVPDFRGMFLRGIDSSGEWDVDNATRFGDVVSLYGANNGTFELSQLFSHNHNVAVTGGATAGGDHSTIYFQTQSNSSSITFTSTTTGGTESRPVNAYVNWFIKY